MKKDTDNKTRFTPVPGSDYQHLSEGKGTTILRTDIAVELKVGGLPTVTTKTITVSLEQ